MDDLHIDYDACDGGRKAIALSKQNEYDLIFMEIQMPDLDGIETTRQIREFDKRFSKNRAIIALTAHALDDEKQKLLEEGFNHWHYQEIEEYDNFFFTEKAANQHLKINLLSLTPKKTLHL